MDLFGDLPPPSDTKPKEKPTGLPVNPKTAEKRKSTGDEQATPTDESEAAATKKCKQNNATTKVRFAFKSFHAERKGERDEMQDAFVLQDDCTEDFNTFKCGKVPVVRAAFYGVFDGHGGCRASNFAKENLYVFVRKNFPAGDVEKFDSELKKGLTSAFKQTDDAFLAEASKETPNWRDGATATCVLALNNILYVSNIGDSKTILVRRSTDAKPPGILPLTSDHSPLEYAERQGIQKAGGFVRDGRVQGVLEVSRAFGDARFKKYVTCIPDITKCTLTDNDRYIIMACDGLWKGFTIKEAVKFIDDILDDSALPGDEDSRCEKACASVASEAIRRGSSDNVTVVLVRISSS